MTKKYHRKQYTIVSFLVLFFSICFVTTANILLFSENAELSESFIRSRAPKVFINVFILSFLFTMLFFIVRYFTSTRHVNEILEATEKITKGDFKTRLKETDLFFDVNGYEIIKQNINRMAEELSGVETLRTDFISNVSHELKTPLTVIQNYATLMQDDNLTENQRKEYSKHIIDQTGRLSSLITNILRLNKLENQKIYPALKEINLTELVCECMINFESAWEEKNLSIDTEIQDEIFVTSDSEFLKIIINNLISNAVKFTVNGGKIKISLEKKSKESVAVSVSDTGCGMDEKIGNHIFEKFYQGETSHSNEGNGLGLALVKRIIDILEYEINVQSKLGVGSTFTVIIK